ncbi:AbiH family protein [Christiangramia aquimixticola]|uniref:AbiH family protein n=1 Tax=Christiangramia aquimixticola TaxID=1697558 RepID=UPI003AA93470
MMNRLILIGNGFDLALGLKTSYSDFMLWLIKDLLTSTLGTPRQYSNSIMYNAGFAENEFYRIGFRTEYSNVDYEVEINRIENIELLNRFREHYNVDFSFKNGLLSDLLKNFENKGWVDIENEFYQNLKKELNSKHHKIQHLNNQLNFITKKLEEYLLEIDHLDIPNSRYFIGNVSSQFSENIKKEDLLEKELIDNDISPKKILFLSFNYTNCLFQITQSLSSYTQAELSWNYIHGELKSEKNPLIFGFGDEIDDDYSKIEKQNDNDFFEHIKSFRYSLTPNYHDLMRFIDAENYQVFVYGHSCGLSDRTMLREIFEHDNCKSIKVFYHRRNDETDDFSEKVMEISRHFTDKGVMRRKIVDKTKCKPLPQN